MGWEEPWRWVAAFAASVAAGAANAAAGAGTTISFPVLVWLGIPPVTANATNAVGLWPGSLAAAWSYRDEISRVGGRWLLLVLPALVAGAGGAWLLVRLPPSWFEALAPFLVLGAAALVGVEPLLRRRGPRPRSRPRRTRGIAAGAALLAIGLYGGYFGAGIGILVLGTLGLLGMTPIHRANGLKNLLAVAIKAAAVVWFALAGIVAWGPALVLAGGSALGGYVAGRLVQRVEGGTFRWVVVAVGVSMGVLMLVLA